MRVGVIHYNSHAIFEMLEFFTPWCKICELLVRPALIRTLVQQILQIAVDVEVMRPGHLNDRVDYCAGICSLDTVTEQPVLAAYCKRPDRILAGVVCKAAPAILQICFRSLAPVLNISDRLVHPGVADRLLLIKP